MSLFERVSPEEPTGREHVRTIAPGLLHQMMQSERHVVVVDVRSAYEFRGPSGHVVGSRSIPLHQVLARWVELAPRKHSVVVTVSQRGLRSRLAGLELELVGFDDVRSLEGGIAAWSALGYPLERSSDVMPAPATRSKH